VQEEAYITVKGDFGRIGGQEPEENNVIKKKNQGEMAEERQSIRCE